jgi:hypothetical protein
VGGVLGVNLLGKYKNCRRWWWTMNCLLQMQWTLNQILVFLTIKKKSYFFLSFYWQPIVKFCNWLKFHTKKDRMWYHTRYNAHCKVLKSVQNINKHESARTKRKESASNATQSFNIKPWHKGMTKGTSTS